jgi:hypothetical protein
MGDQSPTSDETASQRLDLRYCCKRTQQAAVLGEREWTTTPTMPTTKQQVEGTNTLLQRVTIDYSTKESRPKA